MSVKKRPLEEVLPTLAREDPDVEPRRARSWYRLQRAMSEPAAPFRVAGALVLVWKPLALLSTVAIAALAFVLAQPPRAIVASVHGQVTAIADGRVTTLRAGDELSSGAVIETPADGWVALRVGEDRMSVDVSSRVILSELSRLPARVVIQQANGRSWHQPAHDPGRQYVVRTDGGDAIARGTAFLVVSAPGQAPEVTTVEGTVQVEGASGSATVGAGQLARLGAAPPVAEPAPVTRLDTTAGATLVDPLGRSCGQGSGDIPGCVASGSGFIVLPSAAKDLSIQVRTTAAGTVEVVAGGQRTEIAVPGQGTFQFKVEVRKSGSEVRLVVQPEAQRVEELRASPSLSPAATASRSPRPADTRSPEGSESPKPSRTPERRESARPGGSPEARESAEPKRSPEAKETAEPKETPEAKETPEPKETPEAEETAEPREGGEAKGTPKPGATARPTSTRRPTASPTPSPAR